MLENKLSKIKKGELSAVENIRSFLKIIKAENGKINALLYVNDNALQEASEIDRKIKQKKVEHMIFRLQLKIN
ncbi:MAG: hypothetical protein IIB05_07070 [Bacteroidetes bacterium]|nr:hypothetical protein [Bacteroidota bacterium]